MFLRLIYIVSLSTIILHSSGAQYLHYNKLGHRMQANYKVGDPIKFTLKETGEPFKGQIINFTDSTIVFKYYEFKPEEIESIYIDEKIMSSYMLKYKWHRVLIMAGIGYPLLETMNYGYFNQKAFLTGAFMVQAGLLIRLMLRKKLPINERYTLTIVHSSNQ